MLEPRVNALATTILASDTLHVNDARVPVLAAGTGKTKLAGDGAMSATNGLTGARPPAAIY